MSRLTNISFLFTVIAIVETLYALLGLLTPPEFVLPLIGWVLNADGQWLAKLLGASLGFQAIIAWMFRQKPHIGVAKALAGYQILAATVDWVMWVWLLNQGIFSTSLAQMSVVASIALHYALGFLLIVAINKAKT